MDNEEMQGMLMSLLPTPAYMMACIVFGMIGFVAYRFGKNTGRSKTRWLGLALMLYPYLIGSDIRLLIGAGVALCVALYVTR